MRKIAPGSRPGPHAATVARAAMALVGLVQLAGCAAHGAAHGAAQAAPPADATVAVRLPPRPAPTVCLGFGTISSREPWEIPRWKYHVQMDDGTESIVFQERADWLVLGARVRITGGEMRKPD